MDWGEEYVYSEEVEKKYFFTKIISLFEYERLKKIEEEYEELKFRMEQLEK